MRRLLPIWSLAIVAWLGAVAHSNDLQPITATVVTPGAAVRSGPAETYYLTDTLPQDTEVEVYRQQPDGWCAIRPPADSFSWVHSRHVELMNDELATINKDEAAARVGSRLGWQRDVVQVRLRKGETVRIVGNDERDGELWYKIAPPAGEFRWVHVRDLAGEGLAYADGADREVTTASHEEPAQDAAGQWAPIAAPPLAAETSAATAANSGTPAPAASATTPTADITPIGAGSASSADIAGQLMDLELRLSRMVAEPMATWSIGPLEQAAEQMLAKCETVEDRQAVKSTLAKIDRFAAIQRRAGATGPAGEPPVATVATPVGTGDGALSSVGPYDAVGVLRPVVSRRPGAPQFALVDEQGQVLTFVTPAPDVNLQPYLGHRIGIAGRRGYIPEFRRPHVTAGRITPLGERMLR